MLAQHAKRFPDLAPEPIVDDGLESREAALAHAIVDASVRHWLTLETVLGRFTSQPVRNLEPRMRAALLMGAAQLIYLDRVPPHAAVTSSVEWVKAAIRPKAGGMVNAVLRRVADLIDRDEDGHARRRDAWDEAPDALPLGDAGAIALREPVLPDEALARLEAGASVPRTLLQRWSTRMPTGEVRRLALHTLATPPTVLCVAHARSALPEGLDAHDALTHRVFTGSHAELRRLLASRDDLWVQDVSSSGAVASVSDLKPGLVVDLCAGLGTKTRQLRATFPDATILATDTDRAKLRTLAGVFEGDARVTVAPMDRVRELALGRADLVLLDVPCSNTGVLARRVEAAYRCGPSRIERLADQQRQIVADTIPLLASSGAILYATCSLEPEENAEIARWAAQWHRFKIERERSAVPGGGLGEPVSSWRDGAYSVLLRWS